MDNDLTNNKRRLVAFQGLAYSGKTTSARLWSFIHSGENAQSAMMLLDDFRYWRYHPRLMPVTSFADPLRAVCEILTGIPADDFKSREVKENHMPTPYEDYNGREFLEHVGTEVIRDTLDEKAWVYACKRLHGLKVVYDDLRMDNEAEYIKDNGGIIIGVTGRGEIRDHRSGKGIDKKFIDFTVDNSKSIMYLAEQLKTIYDGL